MLWPVLGTQAPLILLVLPIIVSAWLLGSGPGLFSTAIAAVTGLYLFIPPVMTFKLLALSDSVRLAIFVLEGILICGLTWRAQQAQHIAQTAQSHEAEADRRFRHLIASVQDYAIMMLDPSGHVTSWNTGAQHILGYTEQEILGQHIRSFYPAEAQQQGLPEQEVLRATKQGRFEHEGWRLRRDGTRFWAHVVLTAISDEHQTLQGFAKVVQDTTEREQADQAIRTSQARLQGILASAMDAIISVDAEQRIILFNTAAEQTFGYAASDILGQPLQVLLPTRLRGRHQSFVQEFGRSGVTTRAMHPGGTITALHRNGHEFPIEASISHVLVANQPLSTVILRDVTAREEANVALRAAEARFAQAFQISPSAIMIVTIASGHIVDANARFLTLVGRTQDQVTGKTTLDIGLWPDPDDRTRLLAYLALHQRVRDYEAVVCGADGIARTVLISVEPINIGGEPCHLVTLYDITDRTRAEAERRRSEARLRNLVLATAQIIWTTDAAGQIVDDSPSWRAFTGQTYAQLTTTGWIDAVHPDDRRQTLTAWQQSMASGLIYEIEHRVRRHDGVYRIMQARGVPIRADDGIIQEWIGSHSDITDQKDLQARYLQAQKLEIVGRLAGGVAHDFNNLLTAITGYTQVALEELVPGSSTYDDLQEIQRAADRAEALTRQLLTFSRQQVMTIQPIDVNQLIAELEKLLRRLIGADIALEMVLDPEAGVVAGDAGQLEQVLVNLVVNARDALNDGGTITMTTRLIPSARVQVVNGEPATDQSAQVVIAVQDTGSGIPDHIRPHLFDPFFTTKPAGQGTGLGLATCWSIIQHHGGTIDVESSVGHGSTFIIFLPQAASAAQARTTQPFETMLPHGSETILLVEDEPVVRKLAGRVLGGAGYTVIEAVNGAAALALLDTADPPHIDLILTDAVMPQLSGIELIEQALARIPGTPVLMISGYAEHHSLARAQALAIQLLPKPFTPTALTQAVRTLLDARQGHTNN